MGKAMRPIFSQLPQQRPSFHQALQQAVALLEMPQLELAQWVEEEVEKNPLLKRLSSPPPPVSAQERAFVPSFYEDLLRQIGELLLAPEEKKIAEALFLQLDEKGFISGDLSSLCQGHPQELVQKTWDKLKTLDPPGIFAANLQESLLLQLQRKGLKNHACYALLQKNFDALLHGKWKKMEKDLAEALPLLSRLSLRPIEYPDPQKGAWIRPDLSLEKQEEKWAVRFHEEEIPAFQFDPLYVDIRPSSPEETLSLRAWKTSANWLFRSLKRRKQILLQVAGLILKTQRAALEQRGLLRPLTIQEGARLLGLHESTLSRALSGKYIATPQGLFPLKAFFKASDTQPLFKALKRLIEEEDKTAPLTDEMLAEALDAKGFSIARRTLVKYRKALRIPAAKSRKFL